MWPPHLEADLETWFEDASSCGASRIIFKMRHQVGFRLTD
jgi:hypothetical protein